MSSTKLLYLDDFKLFHSNAKVLDATLDCVILDQTIFYPQGGGQPCDTGTIKNKSIFTVTDVRLVEGEVKHFGSFTGEPFKVGEEVKCNVNEERRILNSRIHSAGHLIDRALVELGINWTPGKSFHFPQGPYVEYIGSLAGLDKEKLKKDIEEVCNNWIKEGLEVKSQSMTREELSRRAQFVPDYIPKNKPIRVIFLGEFNSPCGGTHVFNISEIKSITIRKIKESDGIIRVSYLLEEK